MNKERTLIILKPDSIQRGLIGSIVSRFENIGLKIVALKMINADKDKLREHYTVDPNWIKDTGAKVRNTLTKTDQSINKTDEELGENVLKNLCDYFSKSPVVVACLEGPHSVELVRKIVGSTEPLTSDVGTIRGDYVIDSYKLADGTGRAVRNLIHASSSLNDAKNEISIWFDHTELIDYINMQDYLNTHFNFKN